MWGKALGPSGMGEGKKWYEGGAKYWKEVPADEKGVLGGYPEIGPPDVATSRELLSRLFLNAQIIPGRAIGKLWNSNRLRGGYRKSQQICTL